MAIRIQFREYTDKHSEVTLQARFSVPERQEDGTVKYRRIERSTRTSKQSEARTVAEAIYRQHWQDAYGEKKPEPAVRLTFAEAATTYMKTTGNKKYLYRIIEKIGLMACDDIDQDVVTNLADELQPGHSAATRNRHVFTPIIAVINLAAEGKKCIPPLIRRPAGHDNLPPIQIPAEKWYAAVLAHAHPHLRAYLMFVRLHGRRVEEALQSTWKDYNRETGELTVYDRKGNQTIQVLLAEPVAAALLAAERWRHERKPKDGRKALTRKLKNGVPATDYIFGTRFRSTIRFWLKNACKAAGVPYYKSKEAGRHAFATRTLEAGHSLKHLQERGKWKTIQMPARRYVHLERQKIDEQVRVEGGEWFAQMASEIKDGVQAPEAIEDGTASGGKTGESDAPSE